MFINLDKLINQRSYLELFNLHFYFTTVVFGFTFFLLLTLFCCPCSTVLLMDFWQASILRGHLEPEYSISPEYLFCPGGKFVSHQVQTMSLLALMLTVIKWVSSLHTKKSAQRAKNTKIFEPILITHSIRKNKHKTQQESSGSKSGVNQVVLLLFTIIWGSRHFSKNSLHGHDKIHFPPTICCECSLITESKHVWQSCL